MSTLENKRREFETSLEPKFKNRNENAAAYKKIITLNAFHKKADNDRGKNANKAKKHAAAGG